MTHSILPILLSENVNITQPEYLQNDTVNINTTAKRWAKLSNSVFTIDAKGTLDTGIVLRPTLPGQYHGDYQHHVRGRILRSCHGQAIAIIFQEIVNGTCLPLGATFVDSANRRWNHSSLVESVYGTMDCISTVYIHENIQEIIMEECMDTTQLTKEQHLALEETIGKLITFAGDLPFVSAKGNSDDLPF